MMEAAKFLPHCTARQGRGCLAVSYIIIERKITKRCNFNPKKAGSHCTRTMVTQAAAGAGGRRERRPQRLWQPGADGTGHFLLNQPIRFRHCFLPVTRGLAVFDLVFCDYQCHSNLDGQGERVHTTPVYANCPDSPSEGSTECPIHTLADSPHHPPPPKKKETLYMTGSELARPLSFTLSTITSKVVEYTPAERADTLALFLLYPYFYSVSQARLKACRVKGLHMFV